MKTSTALKHLRGLHDASVTTNNMAEARALEVAIGALTGIRYDEKAKAIIKRAIAKTKASIAERNPLLSPLEGLVAAVKETGLVRKTQGLVSELEHQVGVADAAILSTKRKRS